MATSSILVDIRANTQRALNDFKAFSAQLDNKFLISGLKLDVVRSALSQINREFQRAIGEQGLTAGQSLRAAENQASLIFSTFKSLGFEASQEVAKSFSEELNKTATKIGSTAADVKKTLGAVGFFDINLPQNIREDLANQLLKLQTDIRNAGLGDNLSQLIQGFLAKEVSPEQLIGSGDALSNMLGVELQKIGGTNIAFMSSAQRTEIVKKLLENQKLMDDFSAIAKETAGYKLVLDRLRVNLFNPRAGLFGALRDISMSAEESTNLTKETYKLVEAVFGPEGTFIKFFKAIGKIVGLEDNDEVLRPVVKGIRWITEQFEKLSRFLESPEVQGVITQLRNTFGTIKTFATDLYLNMGEFLQSNIGKEIGKSFGDTFNKIIGLITTLVKGFGEFLNSSSGAAIAEKAGMILSQFIKLFGSIVSGVTEFINSPTGQKLGNTITRTIDVFLGIFLGIIDSLSKAETLNAIFGNVTKAFDNVLNLFNAILRQTVVGIWGRGSIKLDPDQINKSIETIGTDVRSFINNIGEKFREVVGDTEGQDFFGSILLTILEELAETVGTIFRQLFLLIIENLPQIISGVITGISTGLKGLFTGLFNNEFIGTILAGIATIGLGAWFVRLFRLRFLNPLLSGVLNFFVGSGGPLGAVNRALGGGRPPTGGGGRITYGGGVGGVGRRAGLFFGARAMTTGTRAGQFLGGVRNRVGGIGRGVGGFFGSVGGLGGMLGPISTPQTPQQQTPSRRLSTRQRFNRMYGPGAFQRRQLGNIQFGNIARRGALGLGAAGIITAMTLLSGGIGRTQEIDPMTGEPITPLSGGIGRTEEIDSMTGEPIAPKGPKGPMGAGEAWGKLGSGAAQGAMTGSMLGPWGAAIGGVIGAGMSLMDKGVRDAVGKSIGDFFVGLRKSTSELWQGISSNASKFMSDIGAGLKTAGGRIVKFFTETLPGWWLNGMRTIYIDLPKQIGKFVVELGTRMVSAVAGFDLGAALRNTWEAIKNAPNNFFNTLRGNATRPGQAPGERFGGSVFSGSLYTVGENGPELFSPISNGTIIPNSALTSNNNGSSPKNTSITYNISVNGGGNANEIASVIKAEIEKSWQAAILSSGPSGPNTVSL